MYRCKHGRTLKSRLKAMEWVLGAVGLGLVVGMPIWMLLLGLI